MATKNDFQRFEAFLKQVENQFQGRQRLAQIGKRAGEIIFRRVKNFEGVKTLADNAPGLSRLKDLSDSYRAYRQGKVRFIKKDGRVIPITPKPGEQFPSPVTGSFSSGNQKRSNLTLTGQMLDALTFKVSGREVRVFVANTPRKDSDLTNAQVANFVQDDRPWLRLARKEWDIITQETRSELFKLFRQTF